MKKDRYELGQILPTLLQEANRTFMSKEVSRLDGEIQN
jgi:hypothetical protein